MNAIGISSSFSLQEKLFRVQCPFGMDINYLQDFLQLSVSSFACILLEHFGMKISHFAFFLIKKTHAAASNYFYDLSYDWIEIFCNFFFCDVLQVLNFFLLVIHSEQ